MRGGGGGRDGCSRAANFFAASYISARRGKRRAHGNNARMLELTDDHLLLDSLGLFGLLLCLGHGGKSLAVKRLAKLSLPSFLVVMGRDVRSLLMLASKRPDKHHAQRVTCALIRYPPTVRCCVNQSHTPNFHGNTRSSSKIIPDYTHACFAMLLNCGAYS